MIDFRYHLISIIAVFLALAIGIVLGTTALNSALLDDLRANIQGLTQDKEDLRTQVADLQSRVDAAGAFTESTSGLLLADRLAGRDVVVVAAPGAPGDVREAVLAGVEDAGGRVLGSVLLQPDYLERDPEEIEELLAELTPTGTPLPEGNARNRLAALLASVLVTSEQAAEEPDSPTEEVLEGLREAGLLRLQGETSGPAELVVLVAAPGPGEEVPADEAVVERDRESLVELALQLRRQAAAAVVAGPDEQAGAGGLVDTLRTDAALADQVSTVDDAGSPQGRVGAIYALLDAWRGEVGHYGRGEGTSGPLPAPLPAGLPPEVTPEVPAGEGGSALGGQPGPWIADGLGPERLLLGAAADVALPR